MPLNQLNLQPANPEQHFTAIASLMNTQETEPNTAGTLMEWYNKQQENDIRFSVVVTPAGQLLGFNGIYRAFTNLEGNYSIYLIVGQDFRECGIGSLLYDHLLTLASKLGARTLRARVRDTCDEGIRFATQRGFVKKKHSIEMMFDLKTWDESRYEPILRALEAQGFQFTNMAELGDTQEGRRKLFALNNGAAATDPGSDGIPPWATFE